MGDEAQATGLELTAAGVDNGQWATTTTTFVPVEKLKHGLKVKNLPKRIAALERQGYRCVHPKIARSLLRRIWWALTQ